MPASMTRARIGLLAFAPLLLTLACGGGETGPSTITDPDPPGPGNPPEPPPPTGVLECEIEGYPCSPADVSIELLERSDALGDSVSAMLEAGSDLGQAATWLEARDGMDEVLGDEMAVRFRLTDGIGVWVLAEGALSPAGEPPGAPRAPAPAPRPPVLDGPDFDVVASGQEQKRALVLSPALYDFGEYDDGAAVAGILEATRGYEGGVQYLANAEQTSATVTVASYKGWKNYQVVHVSSHGRRICDGTGCRAVLTVGLLTNHLPPGPGTKAEKVKSVTETGVEIVKSSKDPSIEYLALNRDFFKNTYPSGLDDTVVFLNACQTFGPQATDLVQAIQGNSTVVLGWTEAVYASEALAAATRFYEEAAERGFPSEVAHARMDGLIHGTATVHGPAPTLRLSTRPEGGDLQLREVVHLLHPGSQAMLGTAGKVGIQGIKADGVPDQAPYRVRVDGVTPDYADDMMVTITVDGMSIDPVPVGSGEGNEDGQWIVDGVAPLPYDLQADRDADFQARVTLQSGGESEDQATATLTGDEPIMGRTWEMEATHTTFWSGAPFHTTAYTATATFTLTFVDGQDPQEPNPLYTVTGGHVRYDYNHSYGGCSFSAAVLEFDPTEYDGIFELRFDTTTEPVRYSGWIYTLGPSFTVSAACEDSSSTREHRANNVWLKLPDPEFGLVSGDRRSITGTYHSQVDFTGFSFVQESNYTLKRVDQP